MLVALKLQRLCARSQQERVKLRGWLDQGIEFRRQSEDAMV